MNIIAQAAKNLPGHWYQGHFTDEQGNYCGLGMVAKEGGQDSICPLVIGGSEIDIAWKLMNKVVEEQYPHQFVGFGEFNDAEGRTEDEVIAIMEKAAVRFDEQV